MMSEEQIQNWIDRLPNELMYRKAIEKLEQTLADADSGTLTAERKRVKGLLPKDSVFMDCWELLHDADMCILQVWEDMELLGLSNTRKLLAAIALRSLGMIEAKESELAERITSSVKCEAKTPAEPVRTPTPKTRKPVTKATFSYKYKDTHFVRLTYLYQALSHRLWLHEGTTNTDFEAIFSGSETDTRIRWTGTQQHLYYLISKLFANEYIEVTAGKGKWEIVLSHFLDKDGHEFPDNFNKQKAPRDQTVCTNIEVLVMMLDPKISFTQSDINTYLADIDKMIDKEEAEAEDSDFDEIEAGVPLKDSKHYRN